MLKYSIMVFARYPDDQFDRFWEPHGGNDSTVSGNRDIYVSEFWNVPPLKVFETAMTNTKVEHLEFSWPPAFLRNSTYYIALYFVEDRNSSSRVFDVSINNVMYYHNLNVTPAGACVFATRWPLVGPTTITLTPAMGSKIGPLINAGEIFEVLDLGGRTSTRDGMVSFKLTTIKKAMKLD